MKPVTIRSDDYLWWFYRKRFSIENRQVDHPRNLCNYFWTSVQGLGMWAHLEADLRKLCISSLCLVTLFGMFLGAIVILDPKGLINLPIAVFMTLFGVIVAMAVISSALRVYDEVKKRVFWLPALLVGGFIFACVAYGAYEGTLLRGLLVILAIVIAGVVAIAVIALFIVALFGLVILVNKLMPESRSAKVSRLAETVGAFLAAKKQKVCPLVNPPDDFKAA